MYRSTDAAASSRCQNLTLSGVASPDHVLAQHRDPIS
jgi:hypothetical protein